MSPTTQKAARQATMKKRKEKKTKKSDESTKKKGMTSVHSQKKPMAWIGSPNDDIPVAQAMPMSSDALSSDAREIDDGFENIRAVYYNKNKATQETTNEMKKAIIHLYMESAGEMNKNEQDARQTNNE